MLRSTSPEIATAPMRFRSSNDGRRDRIDVTKQCERDPDYRITTDDFLNWEKTNGKIATGTIVLLRTGFGKHYPDRKKYLGTDERGQAAVAKLHFPGLHPDAAQWLVKNRSIKAIGLDTASIDFGQSTKFENHQTLFDRTVRPLERCQSRLAPT